MAKSKVKIRYIFKNPNSDDLMEKAIKKVLVEKIIALHREGQEKRSELTW